MGFITENCVTRFRKSRDLSGDLPLKLHAIFAFIPSVEGKDMHKNMGEQENFSDRSCDSLSFCIIYSKGNRPQRQKYILNIARLVKVETV